MPIGTRKHLTELETPITATSRTSDICATLGRGRAGGFRTRGQGLRGLSGRSSSDWTGRQPDGSARTLSEALGSAVARPPSWRPLLNGHLRLRRPLESDATIRAYASGWRDFLQSCEHRDVPTMPASDQTVAAYLADMAIVAQRRRRSRVGWWSSPRRIRPLTCPRPRRRRWSAVPTRASGVRSAARRTESH